MQIKPSDLAKYIDHTLLKPEASRADYTKLCNEAIEFKFFSVCVPTSWISFCKDLLRLSNVKVCTVVGFPFGYSGTEAKVQETIWAISQGADEIDMVANIGWMKSGEFERVAEDIRAVAKACGEKTLKVILETSLLSKPEIKKLSELSAAAGAHFVKTSTGFSSGGAKAEDVALMRESVPPRVQVKASGGIRDTATALAMVAAGATRLGTSQSVAIVKGAPTTTSGAY